MEEVMFDCVAIQKSERSKLMKTQCLDQAKVLKECDDDVAKKDIIHKQLCAIKDQTAYNIQTYFEQLHVLVTEEKVIAARVLCEQLLAFENLIPENKWLWVETFKLIKKLLSSVDYKGVREVMKICREKASKCFTKDLRSDEIIQINALVDVLKYIFDRDACLLPAYFIITEIQKPDTVEMHWKVNHLISNYINEFTNVAQMLSIIFLPNLLPVVEHGDYVVNSWRLDPITLKLNLKGALPYNQQLTQPQTKLLRFILEQPYSRDFVCSLLNLQKNQRGTNIQLEENLIWLILSAMERSEGVNSTYEETIPSYWLHLSSQVIYFVLFQFATFPNIINSLYNALSVKKMSRGRNQLMWVLLQFISGSIQRNPIQNFLPVLDLFDLLYVEKEPLPIPDVTNPSCAQLMAPTCIWIHITRKAKLDHYIITRSLPLALKAQYDFLQQLANSTSLLSTNDFTITLLCNAYSTNQEYFSRPMAALIDTILGIKSNNTSNHNCLSMQMLDSLTVHSKMSLIHSIVTHLIAQSKSPTPNIISPGLIETYSRLLVYTEIESLGIKGFLGQLLPAVFKSHAWGVLHTLLEMFSYRINFHIPAHYKVQLLSHLNALVTIKHSVQLHLCIESTSLRIITGLASYEMLSQISRYYIADSKPSGSIVSTDSEELNRTLILTLARSIQNTSSNHDKSSLSWCKDFVNHIMQVTPHSWNPYTLQCFPSQIRDLLNQTNVSSETNTNLKKMVDDQYRTWISLTNEAEAISSGGSSTLFFCVVFKMLFETDNINPYAIKTIEKIGTRNIANNLRNLSDYIISEIKRCVFRPKDNNESQVCFYIIQSLLLKPTFRTRLQDFLSINSPEYWKQNNLENLLQFHQKYPEKFLPDEVSTPIYFGNVCLRLLPVLDLIIHRFIEFSTNQPIKALENILDTFGCLYKFHERPITYLYNTLYYYEQKLRDFPGLKRKLISCIALEICTNKFAISDMYRKYLQFSEINDNMFSKDTSYYSEIVKKVLDAIEDKNTQTSIDWRFNEFPNYPTFSLYTTCMEILCLPQAPAITTHNIMDIISKRYGNIPPGKIHTWINAIGLIIAHLPESYFMTVFERTRELLNSKKMKDWKYKQSPFVMFDFKTVYNSMLDKEFVNHLAVVHAVIQHFNIGQISVLIEYINKVLKPLIKTEYQMIYVCHIICPFLSRLEAEVPRAPMDITLILYEVLEQIDTSKNENSLVYLDPICDLLYHLKYMYIGDMLKTEIETIIKKLSPRLRMRLRFITRLNVVNENICIQTKF
uniref:Mediator of RNA polymerase II transcription subunit 23 n=1 Tax=Culicoides sonorensis TaxID=179676 RepID=A0A336LHK9_CULSO